MPLIEGLLLVACGLSLLQFLQLLLNHLSLRSLGPHSPRGGGVTGLVSICVPARDEERDIEPAMRSLMALDDDAFEIVAVDDRSRDATGQILARLATEDGRLRVLKADEPPPGWLGKPHALETAACSAAGEWLLFVDADVRLHPQTLAVVRTALSRQRLDLLSLVPDLQAETPAERILLPFLGDALMFELPSFLANWPRPRSIAVGAGAFIILTRQLYDRIGGHAALRQEVIDDIRLAIEGKRAGGRVRAALGTGLVQVRMYRGLREIIDGFSKNLFVGFGRSASLVATVIGLVAVQHFLPAGVVLARVAGAAVPPALLLKAAAAVLLVLLCRLVTDVRLGRPLRYSPTYWLEKIGVVGMVLVSAWRTRRRGVVWRGRRYPSA